MGGLSSIDGGGFGARVDASVLGTTDVAVLGVAALLVDLFSRAAQPPSAQTIATIAATAGVLGMVDQFPTAGRLKPGDSVIRDAGGG
jgi:hypothetical protein